LFTNTSIHAALGEAGSLDYSMIDFVDWAGRRNAASTGCEAKAESDPR
jgi:hypothetical protein